MARASIRRTVPFSVIAMTLVLLVPVKGSSEGVTEETGQCNSDCKPAYIGDKNCDKECYNEACDWDGGDCEDQWELRRMIVMGPYYKSVDHVEYTAVGPGGQTRKVSYEEGRQWEGADTNSKEMENDWMAMLDSDDEATLPDEGKRTYEHAPWRKEGVEVTL